MTTVKPTPDYAAIMRAPPSERDQKAMDVLSQVLRDLRGSSLAFFPAQGSPRDLGPPKETDGIGKGLAQAKADGSIGEPIDGGKRKDASGREFKITRWNGRDGQLAAVLLEPVLGGGKGERVLIAPDARRPGNARIWYDEQALVPWGLARQIMNEVRAGNTGARPSGTNIQV
jgi:hypothetical protein